MPGAGLTVHCAVCERFVCGRCARLGWRSVPVRDERLVLWRLACPGCGQALGARPPGQAVLWSAGPEAALAVTVTDEDRAGTDLPDLTGLLPGTAGLLRAVVDRHHDRGIALAAAAAALATATADPAAMAMAERASAEAPWEPVTWYIRALLAHRAGHPHAFIFAVSRLDELAGHDAVGRPLGSVTPAGLVPQDVILRECMHLWAQSVTDVVRSRLGRLPAAERRGRARGRQQQQQALHRLLVRVQAQVQERKRRLLNQRLKSFDASVQAYRVGRVPLAEHVRSLFAGVETAPRPIAALDSADVRDGVDQTALAVAVAQRELERSRQLALTRAEFELILYDRRITILRMLPPIQPREPRPTCRST
jgi:hypothetical protein